MQSKRADVAIVYLVNSASVPRDCVCEEIRKLRGSATVDWGAEVDRGRVCVSTLAMTTSLAYEDI